MKTLQSIIYCLLFLGAYTQSTSVLNSIIFDKNFYHLEQFYLDAKTKSIQLTIKRVSSEGYFLDSVYVRDTIFNYSIDRFCFEDGNLSICEEETLDSRTHKLFQFFNNPKNFHFKFPEPYVFLDTTINVRFEFQVQNKQLIIYTLDHLPDVPFIMGFSDEFQLNFDSLSATISKYTGCGTNILDRKYFYDLEGKLIKVTQGQRVYSTDLLRENGNLTKVTHSQGREFIYYDFDKNGFPNRIIGNKTIVEVELFE